MNFDFVFIDDTGDLIVLLCDEDVNTIVRLKSSTCRNGVPIPLIARYETELVDP